MFSELAGHRIDERTSANDRRQDQETPAITRTTVFIPVLAISFAFAETTILKERKLAKSFVITACSILLFFSTVDAANEIIKNQNGAFSAQLSNAKLTDLTKSLKDNHGIEFKGQEELFQSAISVSFDNLKLEEMVKRILGGKNYVFKYDNQGNLTEVTLLPKSQIDMKARSANPAISQRPPIAAIPPPPASQAAAPDANAAAGSPPAVKEDQENKDGQAPNDPSSQPEIPVPVPDQ